MGHSKLGKTKGKGTGFYGSVIENADYLVDIEMTKERKKRVRIDVEDSRWDKTYVSFLVDLENYLDVKFGEENYEEDPIYATFLEHLKENGRGYMLCDSVEHGVKIPIIYEVETKKKKSPITRESSKTEKESHRKCSGFDDQVKTDSPDTMKRYNTRARQGANIQKKGSLDANKELKSTPKNSGFGNAAQMDPSIVIKKEILRNCEHYNLRKTGCMVKSDLNTKTVNVQAEADSLDEVNKETSGNCGGHYNLRKTRNVETKAPPKPVHKNTKTPIEVEANSLDEIDKEPSGTRHGYSTRKRSGLEADKLLKTSLEKCKVEKDPVNVTEAEANTLDEIIRESSRTRSGYNMRTRSGLEADKQLKPTLKKWKVEKDHGDVNEVEANTLDEFTSESSRTRSRYNMRKRSGLEAEKQSKPSLKKCKVEKAPEVVDLEDNSSDEISRESSGTRSGYDIGKTSGLEADKQLKPGLKECQVEKDPLELDDGHPISREGNVNREEKSEPKNSVFVNEKEGDPSQVIKRNSLKTQPGVNIQNKGALYTDRKVKPGRVFQGKGAHEIDETYNAFFAGLKFDKNSMVYESGDHQKILYEGSAQYISSGDEAEVIKESPRPPTRFPEIPHSCSRPSIKAEPILTPTLLSPVVIPTPLSPPVTPTVTPTPLSPTIHRNWDKASDKIGKGSEEKRVKLQNQLNRILGMPFDQDEFDEIWKDMNHSSEVLIYRDSRSGGTYKPGVMGKSYLEKYPELKGEIKKIKSDPCKVLNLLRMLAFYLKNVPHGIPKPWLPDQRKTYGLDPL